MTTSSSSATKVFALLCYSAVAVLALPGDPRLCCLKRREEPRSPVILAKGTYISKTKCREVDTRHDQRHCHASRIAIKMWQNVQSYRNDEYLCRHTVNVIININKGRAARGRPDDVDRVWPCRMSIKFNRNGAMAIKFNRNHNVLMYVA